MEDQLNLKSNSPKDSVSFYHENGYLILNDCLSKEEISNLKEEIVKIFCKGERGKINGLQEIKENETEDEIIRKYLAFHFPHKFSNHIKDILYHKNIVENLQNVIGPNVKSMQSMLFVKAAGKPGQAWHQDEFYIPTRDRSLTAIWIAIDDATIENGCLWVIPGSHKPGIIWPQRQHNDPRFDAAGESFGYEPFSEKNAVPVELKSGSAILFNGYLLHRSLPNVKKNGFRRALANHYMSAESLLPWDWDGRIQIKDDMRDIVMVTGKDPYHWKPILENLTYPFIRVDHVGQGKHFNEL